MSANKCSVAVIYKYNYFIKIKKLKPQVAINCEQPAADKSVL